MARRYSRDNRGRFASGGTGATARGGRLKTASGNKRATQTTKAAAAKPSGSIAGKVKRNPAAAGKIGQAKAATAAKLGGRLNPAKKAFRAADKKFLNTIQKEKGISKATSDARRDAKSSSDFTKTPTAKGAKLNNTISQTKEKRNIASKQKLLKERLTRAYNLSGNGTDAKGRRTAKVKAKAIATLQGTKRPDISDGTVGGLRKPRTSTGYKAPSSRLPMPSRSARAQGRARALAQTQRFDAVGRRLGNPTKMDNKARTGARAVDFNSNPKAFLRRTLVQKVQSRGGKGTAGFVARPRSLTQTPKRIKPSAAPKAARPAPKVDVNSFNAMKRRYDRTKFENSGLTFNTSDRPRGTKQLVTGINRKRAFGIYRAQAARPLNELTQQKARAPFGKFSTVKNPAPAKAFPSQAPGRTKAAEAKAREYRKAAKRKPKKK